jgi:hypothetical protein
MPSGIYLRLPEHDHDALYDLADREFRHPREQAALFIHQGLRRAGLIDVDGQPTGKDTMNESAGSTPASAVTA